MPDTNAKSADQQAMEIYENIVDNAETENFDISEMIEKLRLFDMSGQFLCSTARYLAAIDRNRYDSCIVPLVEAAIDKDRERLYIGSLLEALWGEDYKDKAGDLCLNDNNFRRIYKRIYPTGVF